MKENTISRRQFVDKGVNAGDCVEEKSAKFTVKLEPKIKSFSKDGTKSGLRNFRFITKDDRMSKNSPDTDVYKVQCSGKSVQILELYKNPNLIVKKRKAVVRQFDEDDGRRKFVTSRAKFECKADGGEAYSVDIDNVGYGEQDDDEGDDNGDSDEQQDEQSILTRLTPAALQQERIRKFNGEENRNQVLPVDTQPLVHKHARSSVPKQKVVQLTGYTEDITETRKRKVVPCEKEIMKLTKSDYRLLPISIFKERFEKIDNLEKLVASIREEISRMKEIFVPQEDLLQFNELYERVRELNSMIINLKSYDSSTSSEYCDAEESLDLKNSSIKPKWKKREKRELSSKAKFVEDIEKKNALPLTSFSTIDAAVIVAAAALEEAVMRFLTAIGNFDMDQSIHKIALLYDLIEYRMVEELSRANFSCLSGECVKIDDQMMLATFFKTTNKTKIFSLKISIFFDLNPLRGECHGLQQNFICRMILRSWYEMNFTLVNVYGHSTVNSAMMRLLGIGFYVKDVILYPIKHYEAVISGIDKHNMTIYGYRYWVTSCIQ
uniref:Uncharacterized protein n=1 Tax=Glossina palpalis gambiensis TaxID=67801 RepID=A0A1B0BGM6_9MUSC